MNSNAISDMQAQAIAFVHAQRGNIYRTARGINPRVTHDDFEDLVHEGHVIALELVAQGGLEHLKAVFWAKLHRSVWSNFDYLVDYMDLNDVENPVTRAMAANDPLARVVEEENLGVTMKSVLDFLSPTEKRVLFLLLGLAKEGRCHEEEASRYLGVARATVRVLLGRILNKINEASRSRDAQGRVIFNKGKPRKHSPH